MVLDDKREMLDNLKVVQEKLTRDKHSMETDQKVAPRGLVFIIFGVDLIISWNFFLNLKRFMLWEL